ncbi:dUTPase [Campylobacter geochelonis]|uniref:Deoxyuridine triphosphatase domain-containing protein n=1 Tax=Campylobacter geochelonis TaxID=1780362 RepID=A0A128EJ78_9BACT|nr:dUTP diphosphatase [Campylobacter geochelonis]QKF71963.1 dUTPase, dimeric [Campylobacter geochelonis]CZE47793.1 deoxyuridine triphosphatase domain-containing protein [Campylobacter geochelonis]CZE49009.1 deoxyuridine triphosphatase domain-containing protein [Campylobacter geochelonis]CZE49957.1 deoxyuridine triphosphatase domain-containing protein [Campylobacter geochelonis]
MNPQEKLKDMFVMQQRLNDETNGIGWENGYAKNGKLINWKRCIYMECAELIESFSWKHWKSINAPTNAENVAVEIVDIWHFLMSLVLEQTYTYKDIDTVVNDVASVSGFGDFCIDAYDISEYSIYEIINDIEVIIHDCSGFNYELHNLLTNYFRVALKCGVNLHNLYEIYIAKNVLNKFRQDNGYQDGSYQKIWNGKEDNVVMSEILACGGLNSQEIYERLEVEYKKIK